MAVSVQFESSRGLETSQAYGPFDFAHVSAEELRVGPDGELFATFQDGRWALLSEAEVLESKWTDVVINAVADK